MAISATATEHPQAIAEGVAIAKTGSVPHLDALGELVGLLDVLFDGNSPPYVGATRLATDIFGAAPAGSVNLVGRILWGSGSEGVAAVVYLQGIRPVLMAVVSFGLPNVTAQLSGLQAFQEAELRAISRIPDI